MSRIEVVILSFGRLKWQRFRGEFSAAVRNLFMTVESDDWKMKDRDRQVKLTIGLRDSRPHDQSCFPAAAGTCLLAGVNQRDRRMVHFKDGQVGTTARRQRTDFTRQSENFGGASANAGEDFVFRHSGGQKFAHRPWQIMRWMRADMCGIVVG